MTRLTKEDIKPILEATLDPDLEQRRIWHPQELAAILEHQWNAPLEADLGELSPERARLLKRLCDADRLLLKSYGDLFTHAMPPIELLKMIKDYAKRNLARPNVDLPEEMAMLLYVLSVVVAKLRCGERLTSQSNETMVDNIESVLAQPWITEPVAKLMRDGLAAFNSATEPGDMRHANE